MRALSRISIDVSAQFFIKYIVTNVIDVPNWTYFQKFASMFLMQDSTFIKQPFFWSAEGCQLIGWWKPCRIEGWKCLPRHSLAHCPSLMKTKKDTWVGEWRQNTVWRTCMCLRLYSTGFNLGFFSILRLSLILNPLSFCRWWKAQMYMVFFGLPELQGLKLWYWVLRVAQATKTTRLWGCFLV